MRALVAAVLLLVATVATASEVGLSGAEGHPRARFPLAVQAAPLGHAALDAAIWRAVDDWNVVAREVLGVQVFVRGEPPSRCHVTIAVEPRAASGRMGETFMETGADGVLACPVRIVVAEPSSRGQTAAETLLYQVVAHELGHALGLAHTRDPRSLMCCIHGSVDFTDPTTREAYVEARRHPDLYSVSGQLRAHYDRFWSGQAGARTPSDR